MRVEKSEKNGRTQERRRFRIGPRTVKTAAAVVISMVIVDAYGATTSKLIFAMLGAMAAVQPTFKESVTSCLTQIVGVLFGALVGVLLMLLPVSHLVMTAVGILLVITLYNALGMKLSPSLPCFMVVMLCTTPGVEPVTYALGRIWDTAIGLGVGMVINTLIFPYDNRREIRRTMESLDRELLDFLEDMFDGDDVLPDAELLAEKIDDIDRQLKIFADQRFIMMPGRYRAQLAAFQEYELYARRLVAHMEVLCRMDGPGRLSEALRERLTACGASIRDCREGGGEERDVITSYHVDRILTLREKLREKVAPPARKKRSFERKRQ